MVNYVVKHILLDTIYFPLWWYTNGLVRIISWAGASLKEAERVAALKIWLKSMFKPMFQDYSREGRIISFIMRFFLLIFKLIMMVIWTLFVAFIILLWLALPLLTIGLILLSIGYDIAGLVKLLQ